MPYSLSSNIKSLRSPLGKKEQQTKSRWNVKAGYNRFLNLAFVSAMYAIEGKLCNVFSFGIKGN